MLDEMTKKELAVFEKKRGDQIELQTHYLIKKQENEVAALDKKLNAGWGKHDKDRKSQ